MNAAEKEKYSTIRKKLKLVSSIFPSVYDITSNCNLNCEGCYYYEGEGNLNGSKQLPDEEWVSFFSEEKARGVNFPHIAGGEPSLRPALLLKAWEIWKQGAIYTNGTLPVEKDINFKIIVSIWGDKQTDELLRGKDTWDTIYKHYANDARASLLFTVNRLNIDSFPEVMQFAETLGIDLCISIYSPTRKRLDTLEKDLLSVDSTVLEKLQEYVVNNNHKHPSIQLISPIEYFSQAADPSNLFNVDDATNWAKSCSLLDNKKYRHYSSTQKYDKNACCTPYVDCSECRVYLNVYTRIISNAREYLANKSLKKLTRFEGILDAYLNMHYPRQSLSSITNEYMAN